MNFNEYQDNADKTAIYPHKGSILGLVYCTLGLGESGEVQGKVKKILRDDNNVISDEKRLDIKKELGDILWYVAMCSRELGFTLDEVAQANINKLNARKEKGTLQGSGDNR